MIVLDKVIEFLIENNDSEALLWIFSKMDNKANLTSIIDISEDIIFSELKNKTELIKLLISGAGITNKDLKNIKQFSDEAGLEALSNYIIGYSGINENSNFISRVNRIL